MGRSKMRGGGMGCGRDGRIIKRSEGVGIDER